uniref:CHK domain-containing protein n=1 Tax=Parastrongyloides trichosuri TaxID=131310 RepID=A0A0N4ZL61_PARTI
MFSNREYENLCIKKTNISYKWIFETLKSNCKKFSSCLESSKIKKFDYYDISGGKGFASKVYRSTVYFDDEKIVPFEFVLKVPGAENVNEILIKEDLELGGVEAEDMVRVHDKECLFYFKIAKEIENFKVPKCYGYVELVPNKSDGALIMELLSIKSECLPYYESYNIYQVKSILDEVMKLQLFSLTNGKEWKSKLQDKHNERFTGLFKNIIGANWPIVKNIMPSYMVEEIEEDVEALISHYQEIGLYHIWNLPEARGENNSVIVHADLWTNNIMIKKDDKGRFTNDVEAIIDFQTVFEGDIGMDIARFILIGCSPEIRRQAEMECLPEYHAELKKKVIEKGESFNMTYETFKRIYDFGLIDQALMCMMIVGINYTRTNITEKNKNIWEARILSLSSRIYVGIKDAIEKAKILKPEWLKKKIIQ